jgi:hypothetical protein
VQVDALHVKGKFQSQEQSQQTGDLKIIERSTGNEFVWDLPKLDALGTAGTVRGTEISRGAKLAIAFRNIVQRIILNCFPLLHVSV